MPKEYVYQEIPVSGPVSMDDPTPAVDAAVEVAWGRQRPSVQIATGCVPAAGFDEATALYVQLDRARINRLIQILRRARDQAFGADA